MQLISPWESRAESRALFPRCPGFVSQGHLCRKLRQSQAHALRPKRCDATGKGMRSGRTPNTGWQPAADAMSMSTRRASSTDFAACAHTPGSALPSSRNRHMVLYVAAKDGRPITCANNDCILSPLLYVVYPLSEAQPPQAISPARERDRAVWQGIKRGWWLRSPWRLSALLEGWL